MHANKLGIVTLLFLSLFLIPSSFSQTNFEGKIVFQVEDEGTTQQMSYLVKGKKFKIEPEQSQGQGVMIFDNETRMMTILMPSQKMYMEMPMDNEGIVENDETEYFVKTGESREINGYKCDKFEFKDSDGEGVAWMTKELGGFLFFNDPESHNETGWQQAITEEGYFPMEVYQKDASGSEKSVFKIVELKPMNLDDTLFDIPPGFKKLDMSGMMNQQK